MGVLGLAGLVTRLEKEWVHILDSVDNFGYQIQDVSVMMMCHRHVDVFCT
jgi:hypothetical protein